MTDEEFLPKLREAFAIEAREHVQATTDGLLELEKTSEPARQKQLTETIYREVHSLKGAAGAVNRTDLQTVCQAMEDVFSQWKRQTVQVAAESFDALSRTVDLIGKLLRLPDVAKDAAQQEEIAAMTRRLGELLRTQPATSAAAPPVTASMPEAVRAGTQNCAGRLPLENDRPASPQPDSAPPPTETPAPDGEAPQLSDTVRIRVSKMDSLLRKAEEMV